jgi:hypothetical protein
MRSPIPIRAALIVLVVAGCAGGKASPTPGETAPPPVVSPSASASIEVSPSPTALPTEAPTVKPTAVPTAPEQQPDGTITWVASDPEAANYGEALTAPDFNGIKPKLVDGKIEYLDGKGLAATLETNLEMKQTDGTDKETGVIVARADIVTAMTKRALADKQFEMAIPIDLRNQEGIIKVSSGNVKVAAIYNMDVLSIELSGDVADTTTRVADLIENNPDNTGIVINTHEVINYELGDYGVITADTPETTIAEGQELMNVHILSQDANLTDDTAKNEAILHHITPGTVLANTSAGTVMIGCYTPSLSDIGSVSDANIFNDGGIPIAIAGN